MIDRNLAREDAQKLYQAGERQLGTDESAFLAVMAIRHYYQLRATFEEYVKVLELTSCKIPEYCLKMFVRTYLSLMSQNLLPSKVLVSR